MWYFFLYKYCCEYYLYKLILINVNGLIMENFNCNLFEWNFNCIFNFEGFKWWVMKSSSKNVFDKRVRYSVIKRCELSRILNIDGVWRIIGCELEFF